MGSRVSDPFLPADRARAALSAQGTEKPLPKRQDSWWGFRPRLGKRSESNPARSVRTFILSNNEAISVRLREILGRKGHDCVVSNLAPLGQIASRLAESPPTMLVVVLSPDPELALAALGALRGAVHASILAVGPASESRLILRALREGATHYVDESALEAELESALPRLGAEEAAPIGPGQVVAVLGASGGSGASTVSVNLAAALAQTHRSCVLFDLKPGPGDLSALLDLKPTYTLADLCMNPAGFDQTMFQRSLACHDSGVQLLAPPRTLADARRVMTQGIRQALMLAQSLFPCVVADLDDCYHEEQIQALQQADLVLLVLRLDFTSLRNARRILEQLEEIGIFRDQVRVVVNRFGQPEELAATTAEEALGLKIAHYVPDDPRTINRANNSGVPAVIENPRSSVAKSFSLLARTMVGQPCS